MAYLDNHLALCGFMGAGKSTVAGQLARRLDLPMVELDQLTAKLAGASINTIFSKQGEAAFRDYEKVALQQALTGKPAIISLGGGTPCLIENFTLIKEQAHSIYLQASFESCLLRTMDSDRPLLRRTSSSLEKIYHKRVPIYSELAELTIDTDTNNINSVLEIIILHLQMSGIYHG